MSPAFYPFACGTRRNRIMHALGGPEVGADARVGTPTNGLIIARLRNRTIAWRARSLANYVPNGRDRHRQYLSKLAHGVGATARMRRMTANLMLAMRATKRMGAQLSSISDSGVQMEQLLHFGDLYSPDAMCRRRALRDHAHVLEVMEAFWTTALRSNARDRQRQRLPPSTGVVLVSEARTDECCKHGALALPPKPPNKPLGIRARDLAAMRYARPCSYEVLRMPSRAGSPLAQATCCCFGACTACSSSIGMSMTPRPPSRRTGQTTPAGVRRRR